MGAGKAKERARLIVFRASGAAMGAAISGQRESELGAGACERSQGQPFCREARVLPAPGEGGSGFFVPFSLIIFVYLKISRILKPLLCPLVKVAAEIS